MLTLLDFAFSYLTVPGQRTKSPHQSNGDLPGGTTLALEFMLCVSQVGWWVRILYVHLYQNIESQCAGVPK